MRTTDNVLEALRDLIAAAGPALVRGEDLAELEDRLAELEEMLEDIEELVEAKLG
jgi:hypothetical protein